MISFKQYLTELYKPNIKDIINAVVTYPSFIDFHVRRQAVIKSAEDYKFKKLGEGLFAVVVKHEGYPFVIKIWENDKGYDKWINFCINNQDNKWVPQIKGKPVSISHTKYKAVRLEYLASVSRSEFNDFKDKLYKTNDNQLLKVKDFISRFEPGVHQDLHDGNVMKRQNGQIVITDPLAG